MKTDKNALTTSSNCLVVDVDKDQEQAPQTNNTRLRNGAMSITSRFYDRGNKGYLDETEELVRSYDNNGDGTIDMEAAMDLAHTARAKERKVQQTRTWAIVATVAAILFATATFGLVWVALLLSKEVETDGDNALVSATSKTIVKTYSHGCLNHFEFIQELLKDVDGDGNIEVELEADDDGLALLGQVPLAEMEETYAAISQDFHVCTVMWTLKGIEYARKIDPTNIQRRADPTTGNILYDRLLITDDVMGDVLVAVKCKNGAENCLVYEHLTEGRRKLKKKKMGCFSPKSSVMTENKGQINIMDLSVNDRVLTKDGSYSTIYSFSHRSVEKDTMVLRIETETAVIELTPNHMIYLAGKDLPVIAQSVAVGDNLVRIADDLKTSVTETVMNITEINTKGFVSPLTVSGDIVVDNILASSYSVVGNLGSEYYYFHGKESILNIHSQMLAHVSMAPLRVACTWVSSSLCKEEYHHTEQHEDYAGTHFYTTSMLYLVKFVLSDKCGTILHTIVFAVIVGSCLLLFLVEKFLPAILLCGGAVSFTLASKKTKINETPGTATGHKLKAV